MNNIKGGSKNGKQGNKETDVSGRTESVGEKNDRRMEEGRQDRRRDQGTNRTLSIGGTTAKIKRSLTSHVIIRKVLFFRTVIIILERYPGDE